MPQSNNQIETTLADLAIGQIFERTPGLADHYLGFELVPGSVNEEKTRAAGMLGFRVGNEEIYIPVLFLNGKVKGTEVLYLKNGDVWTSNSKQWVDYLTTRDTGTMGSGATPTHPLQQPMVQNMAVFSRNPAAAAKMAGFEIGNDGSVVLRDESGSSVKIANGNLEIRTPGKIDLHVEGTGLKLASTNGNVLEAFWDQISGKTAELECSKTMTPKRVLERLGKKAYVEFLEFLDKNPAVLEKMAHFYDLEKELFIHEWPEAKVATIDASTLPQPSLMIISPEDITKVAEMDKEDAKPENKGKSFFERHPWAAGAAGAAAGVGISQGIRAYGRSRYDEGFSQGKKASLDAVDEHLAMIKIAAIQSLTPEQKEECFERGILFIDKRAEAEKTLVVDEDYKTRFSSPTESGFYEVIGKAGTLEKVFVAHQPFLVEDPRTNLFGCLILDPESGVFCLPPIGEQIFVRRPRNTEDEPEGKGKLDDTIKEKIKGMSSVSSMEIGKAYMLVSPSMKVSSPFTVRNKTKSGGDLSFTCESPWDIKYRSGPGGDRDRRGACYPVVCSSDDDKATLFIVDRGEDEANVVRIGSITHVPSSWKVVEVYPDSLSLRHDWGSYPGASDEESKKREAERKAKQKVYYSIQPGTFETLSGALSERGVHELTLHKSAGQYKVRIEGETFGPMSKIAASAVLVGACGLSHDDAHELLGLTIDEPGIKRWMMPKEAMSVDIPDNMTPSEAIHNMAKVTPTGTGLGAVGAVAGGLGGLALPIAGGAYLGGKLLGATTEDEAAARRRKLIGNILGGVAGGYFLSKPMGAIGALAGAGAGGFGGLGIDVVTGNVKHGAGPSLNGDNLIYGGMPFPPKDIELGTNQSGVMETQPTTQLSQIPLNSMADPSQDWRNMDEANWDKVKPRDLDFIMRAADSGSKPVFESSILNLLLRTNRTSNQVDEWLPDLVKGLDSKCRLLLLFYWHNADFSEDYGKDEMAEFEDVLLNSIKTDGQLVLFLKQKAGESANANIDAFSAG